MYLNISLELRSSTLHSFIYYVYNTVPTNNTTNSTNNRSLNNSLGDYVLDISCQIPDSYLS